MDVSGTLVKKDPIAYAFIWIGIIALAGVLLTAILSFVFAVPRGMMVTKILNKFKSPRASQNLID